MNTINAIVIELIRAGLPIAGVWIASSCSKERTRADQRFEKTVKHLFWVFVVGCVYANIFSGQVWIHLTVWMVLVGWAALPKNVEPNMKPAAPASPEPVGVVQESKSSDYLQDSPVSS